MRELSIDMTRALSLVVELNNMCFGTLRDLVFLSGSFIFSLSYFLFQANVPRDV